MYSLRTLTFAVIALCSHASAGPPPKYCVIDLGALPSGFRSGDTQAINDGGSVVGNIDDLDVRGFRWVREAGMTFLDDLPGGIASCQPIDINAGGVVVGVGNGPNGRRAVRWLPGGSALALGVLAGTTSEAMGVNYSGLVVGRSSAGNGNATRAFRWRESDGMIDLGILPNATEDYSAAFGLNDSGAIVGQSGSALGRRACLWTPEGSVVDLGDLPDGLEVSWASDINATGSVVGMGSAPGGERACLWIPGQPPTDLGSGRAQAINDAGVVVGFTSANGGDAAFIWRTDWSMLNLNGRLRPNQNQWTIISARDINNLGWIAAVAKRAGSLGAFAVLLIPHLDTDVNCDFALDGFDVETMERAVGGDLTDYCHDNPDINEDFALDGFDVETVELAVGGYEPCP